MILTINMWLKEMRYVKVCLCVISFYIMEEEVNFTYYSVLLLYIIVLVN
jgi:hypothetical protein